jgi:hypothetical protein
VTLAQGLIGRELPPQPVHLGHLGHILGPKNGMLVKFDEHTILH